MGAGSYSAPLLVGGNFSSKTDTSATAAVFDQQARDAEVASLNAQLKNKQFDQVIQLYGTIYVTYSTDEIYTLHEIGTIRDVSTI